MKRIDTGFNPLSRRLKVTTPFPLQSVNNVLMEEIKQPSNKFHLTYYNRFTLCSSCIGELDSYQQYFDLLKMFSKRNKYSQENRFIYVQLIYIYIYIYLYWINIKSKFTQQMTLSGQYKMLYQPGFPFLSYLLGWGHDMTLCWWTPWPKVRQIKTFIKFKLNICVGAPSYFWLQQVYLLMAPP